MLTCGELWTTMSASTKLARLSSSQPSALRISSRPRPSPKRLGSRSRMKHARRSRRTRVAASGPGAARAAEASTSPSAGFRPSGSERLPHGLVEDDPAPALLEVVVALEAGEDEAVPAGLLDHPLDLCPHRVDEQAVSDRDPELAPRERPLEHPDEPDVEEAA